jgi:hypothetical protein
MCEALPGFSAACLVGRCQSAKGIVTRMGGNPQGFRAAGIEPGAVGIRPAAFVQALDSLVDFLTPCDGCNHPCRTDQAGCVERYSELVTEQVFAEAICAAGAAAGACARSGDGRAVPLGNTGTTTSEAAQ